VFEDEIENLGRVGLEGYWEAMNLKAVVREGGVIRAGSLFIGQHNTVGMSRIKCNIVCRETGWKRERVDLGMMQCAVSVVLRVYCTQC
jgi:hypothetical protein